MATTREQKHRPNKNGDLEGGGTAATKRTEPGAIEQTVEKTLNQRGNANR